MNTDNMIVKPLRPALTALLNDETDRCTGCGICVKECGFLKLYGTPRDIAKAYDPEDPRKRAVGFECSLCSLCSAVCPEGLDPMALFLEMRREAFERGHGSFPEHKGLLGYERTGVSKRFTWYGLPENCDTVFFPGCALPGTRPEATHALYKQLMTAVPALGLVLDCCTKPSHDLGRQEQFIRLFEEMAGWLESRGVKRILVACPNCYKVFSEYAPQFETVTVYEILALSPPARLGQISSVPVTIHDPCVVRFSSAPQTAVRRLLSGMGRTVEEMPHTGATALCCGEGGTVGALAPDLASGWGELRAAEALQRPIVTYCAGCANHLGKRAKVSHILDLAFDTPKPSKGLITYLNRLRLKSRFKKEVPAAVYRERTINGGGAVAALRPLLVLAAIVAVIVFVRMSGISQYLEPEKLRALFAGFGVVAPLVYIGFYTVAPALMLPGLPISLAGATVFGPVWGVVYTIIGATLGACVAFLIARYAARDWVERRLVGSRWSRLDSETEQNGWKAVAFTRLIPLFPFNLLNFAFGLTKISFLQYALATFIFMLPGTIAFITFSSSLLGLLKGRVSPEFFIGILLIITVSMIPRITRWFRNRKVQTPHVAPWTLAGSLKRKAVVMAVLAVLSAVGYTVVQKLFWALNAYLYTLEFNLLTVANRLKDADLAAFVEYLRPMSTARGAVIAAVCQWMQTFVFPFSSLPTTRAFVSAFGLPQGALYVYITGIIAVGLAACCGRFVLGDLLPLNNRRNGLDPLAPSPAWSGWCAAVLAAVPGLPLLLSGLFAGVFRVPLHRVLVFAAYGLFFRFIISIVAL